MICSTLAKHIDVIDGSSELTFTAICFRTDQVSFCKSDQHNVNTSVTIGIRATSPVPVQPLFGTEVPPANSLTPVNSKSFIPVTTLPVHQFPACNISNYRI